MKNTMLSLSREYALHMFDIISVELFEWVSQSNPFGYHTTRGAFIFPLSGAAEIRFDDLRFVVRKGTLLHGCPGKYISFHVPDGEVFRYINIYYHQTNSDLIFTTEINMDYLSPLLEKAVELNKQNPTKYKPQRDILLKQIFDEVFHVDEYPYILDTRTLVETVIQYIEENIGKPHSLKSLAAYAGTKPEQLSYFFYKYMGMRPIDYLIARRIEKALALLQEAELPVKTVAELVGYNDPLYFSRIFKKRMGYTPRQVKGI